MMLVEGRGISPNPNDIFQTLCVLRQCTSELVDYPCPSGLPNGGKEMADHRASGFAGLSSERWFTAQFADKRSHQAEGCTRDQTSLALIKLNIILNC